MLDSVEGWSSRKVSVMSRMQHMVNLSADDRAALRAFTAMGAHAARAHTRARILLLTDRHARGPRVLTFRECPYFTHRPARAGAAPDRPWGGGGGRLF